MTHTPTQDLFVDNMETIQCYVGSSKPFWDLPYQTHGFIAPTGWIQHTWGALYTTPLCLKGPLATVKPQQAGDQHIIDALMELYNNTTSN